MFQAILLFSLLCKSDGANGPQVNSTLSNLELIANFSTTAVGRNETIHCFSKNGSLPITYIMFLNRSRQGVITMNKRREATFYIVIKNDNLGPYKCKANNSDNRDIYSNNVTFTLAANLSKPKLISESSTTMIGQNKTIRCLSKNGSLPITFSLFLNKSTQGVSTVSHEREATFYVLIQNIGPYKCKANNSNNSVRYSQEFNFSLLEPLINTSIRSDTSLTTRGHNETLQCLSKSGSLPITYVLLRNSSVLETITVTERRLAEFHISIVNTHSLGPFRCRANNSVTNSSLSEELSFIMQGENASWRLILCILLPLFLVLIILAFVFTRICKHKKGPTGLLPIDRVYSDGSTEETAIISEDSVQYAEILKRDCNGYTRPTMLSSLEEGSDYRGTQSCSINPRWTVQGNPHFVYGPWPPFSWFTFFAVEDTHLTSNSHANCDKLISSYLQGTKIRSASVIERFM